MVHLLEQDFGTFKNEIVKKYTWQTKSGFKVSIISYGATIQSILVPDKVGELNDVVLGFDDINGYVERNEPYLGATVGRCANRIRGANFQIDGADFQLAKNVSEHDHLHGGLVGFDKVNWNSVVDGYKVTFSYLSKDGEEGYPGDLLTNVTYDVTDDDVINVQFIATSTKKTVINLTNHSYFNLAGHDTGAEELYNHVISINADRITETTPQSIPTGGFVNVGGTPFDLRIPIRLGDVMKQGQNLFDDNFCINTYGNKDLNFVSRVSHPRSGRYLEVYSDQPGVQLYTANFLPFPDQEALVGKSGVGYRRHGAFCLETQNYPDAVHHPNFPSPILKPGDIYKHKVTYRFGTEKYNYPQVVSA
ncbi:galactose mutarotase [Papilio machaon]|uniref:galactose mutarotase n=1 Tax=Papilio machaon TaxID=76193 RepID=UPI001E66409E|nr:galactose mutarotase [Papilio machaon]